LKGKKKGTNKANLRTLFSIQRTVISLKMTKSAPGLRFSNERWSLVSFFSQSTYALQLQVWIAFRFIALARQARPQVELAVDDHAKHVVEPAR